MGSRSILEVVGEGESGGGRGPEDCDWWEWFCGFTGGIWVCPVFEPVFELGVQVCRPWVALSGCLILESDKGIGIYVGVFAGAFTCSVAHEVGLSVEG